MDKSKLVLQSLQDWQEKVYEEIETATDIKVFNTIGNIIAMLNGGVISVNKLDLLITEVLELTKEEKEAVYDIVIQGVLSAHNSGGEENEEKNN